MFNYYNEQYLSWKLLLLLLNNSNDVKLQNSYKIVYSYFFNIFLYLYVYKWVICHNVILFMWILKFSRIFFVLHNKLLKLFSYKFNCRFSCISLQTPFRFRFTNSACPKYLNTMIILILFCDTPFCLFY